MVNATREYLLAMLTHTLIDAALAGQVALAAHELIENAIKYSHPNAPKIRLEVVERAGAIAVTVENEARREDIASLLTEITAVCESKDPLAYYRNKIDQAISRTDGRSCLGLARIRFESQMHIKWSISGRRVRITAIRKFDEAIKAEGASKASRSWLDG
jgi:hypothetical protein